jgi:hypothetical protein
MSDKSVTSESGGSTTKTSKKLDEAFAYLLNEPIPPIGGDEPTTCVGCESAQKEIARLQQELRDANKEIREMGRGIDLRGGFER